MSAISPMQIAIHRLGNHGNNKRVWITNNTLKSVFSPGEKVKVSYDKESSKISIKPSNLLEGNHTISSRGNGTPIIDLKNKDVTETFNGIEKIEILYYKDEIVIRTAKVEKFKNIRANKNGLNTFELFCGAGTLSYFFKKAGFTVKGGLELNEEYLSLFHENNTNDEIFSINGNIEDIHTSYFPKDIDVVLAGIPCTTFSGSNVKLKTALKNKREGLPYDEEEIKKADSGEALTFYVLMAIKAMNPKTVVVEEVVEYSETSASILLRKILENMGFRISETVSTGSHTKRKRWCLVANMEKEIALTDLLQNDGKTIKDFLETPTAQREWKHKDDFAPSRLNERIGIRSCTPNDVMTNTFTTHGTRGTEPILQHPEKPDYYSEFTNREIANIHGLGSDFKIDERKSIGRQIVGQGVTNMFSEVAKRINSSENENISVEIVGTIDSYSSRYVTGNITDFAFTGIYNTSQEKLVSVNEELYGLGGDLEYDVLSFLDPTGSCCIDAKIVADGKIIKEIA